MRRIRWAPAAANDLESIHHFLEENRPTYTQSAIQRLYDAARSLKQFSHRGRIGQQNGTRELLVTPLPYIIVYGVEHDIVHIFRIMHTSEDRP